MTTTEAAAYNYVRRGVARTRAELARVMRVSRPTASTVTESLISSGLLCDGGKCRSSGGRSPTLLIPRPDAFSLIGVDLNGSGRLVGVRVDALGDITAREGETVETVAPERLAAGIISLWDRLDPDFSALGIGIAVERGATDGDALMKLLRRRLIGKYIHFTERLTSAALSEGFRGGAGAERDYLFLSLGKTLESVVCIGGRPFPGAHGAAGELSRLPVAEAAAAAGVVSLIGSPPRRSSPARRIRSRRRSPRPRGGRSRRIHAGNAAPPPRERGRRGRR